MKCFKCGIENPGDAKECKSCGESLEVHPSDEKTLITDSGKYLIDGLIINNRFKILKRLGKGGMGEIFLAEDVKLKRKIAIKSISTRTMSDPDSKARFLREAQTASQLEHSNICTIYEIYEEEANDYIVMQYVDGVTLDHIVRLKKLSISKIIDIGIQICNGMIEAHLKDIIHRDIKPGNIMVDKKGVVKILDFGLAKFRDKALVKQDGMVESNLTEKGIVLGTVAYMSPEQARGKTLDHGTDIFSFGVVLFEMLEGENPFQDKEQIVTLYNVLNKEAEFIKEIPNDLNAIIQKLLKKDKNHRYKSFSEIRDDLETFKAVYLEGKEIVSDEMHTEIIKYEEQEKLLKEIKRTSDNEDLGDIVNRIKKLKAYTQPLFSTRKKRMKFFLIPLILVACVVAAFIIVNGKGEIPPVLDLDKKFYIYLHNFKNETKEKNLSERMDHLLTESLNQYDPFKTINEETGRYISGNEKKGVNLRVLKEKFNILFELKGNIARSKNLYTIKARLIPLEKGEKKFPITLPGFENKDSLLTHQIDKLSVSVYNKLFPQKKPEGWKQKKIVDIYGTDWKQFSNFYVGYKYYKKLDISKCKKFLSKSEGLLISKYILADLYVFTGDIEKSTQLIRELDWDINKLTDSLRLRVLALKARLSFDFNDQVKKLEEIKNDFDFSKEIFYDLGEAYFQHGNPDKAIEYYEKAIELDKNYSKAMNHLGYCYSHLGNHTKAIELFEDYRDLDQTANSFDSLGDGYFYAGDLVSAKGFKNTAIKTDERGMSWSYLTLGDIYILQAEFEKAKQAFNRYGELRNTKRYDARVLSKKAFIAYDQNKMDEALALIDQSIETFDSVNMNNNTAEAHWIRGFIRISLNQLENSREELKWLEKFSVRYKLSRENFSAPYKFYIHLRALISEKEKNIENAHKDFKYLMSMKNQLSFQTTYYNYQFFHTEYAEFLIRKGEYKTALDEISRCLEFNKDYIPALWVKAKVLEKLNDNSWITVYEKISELYGTSEKTNSYRELLEKKLKKKKTKKKVE